MRLRRRERNRAGYIVIDTLTLMKINWGNERNFREPWTRWSRALMYLARLTALQEEVLPPNIG